MRRLMNSLVFKQWKEQDFLYNLAEMIIIRNKELHIEHFRKLIHFSNEKIILEYGQGKVTIKGKQLYIKQFLMQALIIEGEIIEINFTM